MTLGPFGRCSRGTGITGMGKRTEQTINRSEMISSGDASVWNPISFCLCTHIPSETALDSLVLHLHTVRTHTSLQKMHKKPQKHLKIPPGLGYVSSSMDFYSGALLMHPVPTIPKGGHFSSSFQDITKSIHFSYTKYWVSR